MPSMTQHAFFILQNVFFIYICGIFKIWNTIAIKLKNRIIKQNLNEVGGVMPLDTMDVKNEKKKQLNLNLCISISSAFPM